MLQPGSTLHRGYVIEAVIGKGGMGAVYLARQNTLGGRRVAIKETTVQVDDPSVRALVMEQFAREAHILAAIDHPNLVDVKDFFEEGGAHYMVMAYIDGETLQQVLERSPGPLEVEQVLTWMDPLCDVLSVLHEQSTPVLVRDLKPSNVMIDRSGRIRLIDFGIARVHDSASARTSNLLKGAGTVGYAPVEQFGGQGTDARADIYALGATLYALVTRTVPPWAMHMATGEAVLQRPSTINPAVPTSLDAVIGRMMALRRDERYPTVRETRQALQNVLAEVRAAKTSGASPAPRFCIACGSAVQAGQNTCPRCGDNLAEQAQRIASASGGHPAPPLPPPPPNVGQPPTIAQAPPAKPRPPQENQAPPTGIFLRVTLPKIVIAVLTIALTCLYAYQSKRTSGTPSPPPSPESVAPAVSASPSVASVSPAAGPSLSPPAASPSIAAAQPEPTVTPEVALRTCVDNLSSLQNSLNRYQSDNKGMYPRSLDELVGRYTLAIPTCPAASGAPYRYETRTAPAAFTVMCDGWNHNAAHIGRWYPRLTSKTGLHEHNPDLDITPTTAQQWFDRGFAYYQRGDYELAQSDFRRASALDPKWGWPDYYIGEGEFEQQRYASATKSYTRALGVRKVALFYRVRGNAYTHLLEYRKAVDDYVEADKLEKSDPETYASYAFVLYMLGRFDNALDMCERSLKLDLRNQQACITRYWCELSLGKGAAAATGAQSFLAMVGWGAYQSPYSVLVGSLGYKMEKRDAEATALLDSGLARLKHEWPYPCVQHLAGQIDAATLLAAVTDRDKQTEAQFYIGMKAALEGRKDDARTALSWVRENGVRTFFEHPAALAWLARI